MVGDGYDPPTHQKSHNINRLFWTTMGRKRNREDFEGRSPSPSLRDSASTHDNISVDGGRQGPRTLGSCAPRSPRQEARSATPKRVAAKVFLLTYAQCDMEKQNMVNAIGEIKSKIDIEWLICGQEEHEDGGLHLHVCLGYVKKKDIDPSNYFEVNGFHPNIASHKFGNVHDMINYCRKEDKEPIIVGTLPEVKDRKKTRREICAQMAKSASVEEGMQLLLREMPEEYMKSGKFYRSNLRDALHVQEDPPLHVIPEYCTEPFIIPDEVLKWREEALSTKGRMRCLLVSGESQLAKTEMILSVFPEACYMQSSLLGQETLKWKDGPKFLIIDDLEWFRVHQEEMKKWLCQRTGKKANFRGYHFHGDLYLTWATILIANDEDLPTWIKKKGYWEKNITRVEIKERCY